MLIAVNLDTLHLCVPPDLASRQVNSIATSSSPPRPATVAPSTSASNPMFPPQFIRQTGRLKVHRSRHFEIY